MTEFDKLIEQYGTHNSEFTSLKKTCEAEKDKIKGIMQSENLEEYVSAGYKVTCTTSERETVNEELMLQILREDWVKRHGSEQCPYIKTREYVDTDVLESVLYEGSEISDEVLLKLDACRNVTEVVTLRCTAVKKKKEDS